MSGSEFVQLSTEGSVSNLTLARPEAGNRLSNAMALAVVEALDAASSSRVIVLRAQGPDFCLGRDMAPPAPGAGVRAADVLRDDAAPMLSMYEAFRRCRQPVVAVVAGRAWGIGLVLAALCDVTLAAETSSFCLRELDRGIPPCVAMAPLLDRLPTKMLGYLVYSAQEIGASAALVAGIVSRLVDEGDLQAQTTAFIERLLSFPAPAVEAVKQFLATAPRGHQAQAELYGASLLANVLGSR